MVKWRPRARASARSVMAYMRALPPLSECPAKTRASDQRTLWVPRPMRRVPDALSAITAVCQISLM